MKKIDDFLTVWNTNMIVKSADEKPTLVNKKPLVQPVPWPEGSLLVMTTTYARFLLNAGEYDVAIHEVLFVPKDDQEGTGGEPGKKRPRLSTRENQRCKPVRRTTMTWPMRTRTSRGISSEASSSCPSLGRIC